MDDIFHLIRDGNSLAVKNWLNTNENDFNQGDDHDFTLLHWACWYGRTTIAELLVQRGTKTNVLNKSEDTPLHCAVQNDHLDIACLLISNKADINAYNIHGNTPLHYACHFGYSNLCFELIKMGAQVNCCNRYGVSPTGLCRKALRELLLNLARSYDLPVSPVAFRENSLWTVNRNKSKDIAFACQSGINIDELPVERMLESNHGGTTWKGFWQSSEVVIKVLKLRETSPKIASAFNQECKRLRIFNSANVLPLLGSCVSLPDLIIVCQFMQYGSIYSLLHEGSRDGSINPTLDFNQTINLAIHIAKGMEFLHNLDPMITTGFELNSRHVMVDEDMTAKINMSDCRFSFCDRNRLYHPAWMAPEALTNRPDQFNKKSSDMWSFAVILWELYTRQVPFAEYASNSMQCGLKIRAGMRLEFPVGMSSQMQKLIRICMNDDASKRPGFDMIKPILEKLNK